MNVISILSDFLIETEIAKQLPLLKQAVKSDRQPDQQKRPVNRAMVLVVLDFRGLWQQQDTI